MYVYDNQEVSNPGMLGKRRRIFLMFLFLLLYPTRINAPSIVKHLSGYSLRQFSMDNFVDRGFCCLQKKQTLIQILITITLIFVPLTFSPLMSICNFSLVIVSLKNKVRSNSKDRSLVVEKESSERRYVVQGKQSSI